LPSEMLIFLMSLDLFAYQGRFCIDQFWFCKRIPRSQRPEFRNTYSPIFILYVELKS
jgi:hypothetical protein